MSLEEYRAWIVVGSLALMLAAATPTFALFVHLPSSSEKFSELWLLGPGRKAENYPFNVRVNQTYSVYVGVGNQLGNSAYYKVFVKLRNQTLPLPESSNATPSVLPPLYEFNFFVKDGEAWEASLNFEVLNVERSNNITILNSLSVNEVAFRVDSISVWDPMRSGFYYQLFFELWLYNVTSGTFQYHNRFVGIWLNMTR